MDKLAMNVPELSKVLGLSLSKAYELVRRPDFPSVKVGKRWIIPVDALKGWLDRQAEEKTPV